MRFVLVSSLLLLSACATSPPARPPIKLGEEFALALGESVRIERENVTITFEKVIEDSRCPMNARCIWEGNARIAIRCGKAACELNTSTRFNTREKIADFFIELRRLEPDRAAGVPIKGYVATLFAGTP